MHLTNCLVNFLHYIIKQNRKLGIVKDNMADD